jgi:hypothetical protein
VIGSQDDEPVHLAAQPNPGGITGVELGEDGLGRRPPILRILL